MEKIDFNLFIYHSLTDGVEAAVRVEVATTDAIAIATTAGDGDLTSTPHQSNILERERELMNYLVIVFLQGRIS